jgi:hypothetical protein
MTHHNQTKELTTWFLNLPLDEPIDIKRHKVLSSNLRPHEAQLEDQKSQEKLKKVIYKKKNCKSQQKAQKVTKPQKEQEKLRTNTPPNTLNASSPP